MRAVVQRVGSARISVAGEEVSSQGRGLLALVGVAAGDRSEDAQWLAAKLVHLRVFPDAAGAMNQSLLETAGTLAVVSQFTLLGDARRGRRPSFSAAAAPEQAAPLIDAVVRAARAEGVRVVTGRFQAHMQVELVNDGPVTLLLDSERLF
ncbi:MAG: D-tyrosyl-tRNA(Tyr) deacylase [Myxococcales bacterium]|nr:D-tyrosyl-tRNA(Tyr) deacylase [Myxococcales bacterium]